jgi:uncharacterized surface protein with fasciclin (FAS1) repeats
MKIKHALLAATILLAGPGLAMAQMSSGMSSMSASTTDPMVGVAAMYPSKNIVENAVNSKDHTTLVAAVKAAGLVPTLEGTGPFTVFAPTNEAFAALPAGTVNTLLEPANKAKLTAILTYHVVSGKYSVADIKALITKGGGKAMLPSVDGPDLKFALMDGKVCIDDGHGGMAAITIADVNQSNGVIQVVNKVLLPPA